MTTIGRENKAMKLTIKVSLSYFYHKENNRKVRVTQPEILLGR